MKFSDILSKSKEVSSTVSSKIKENYQQMKVDIAQKKADDDAKALVKKENELARKIAISSGNILPIIVNCNLQENENAYISYPAQRVALVSHTVTTQIHKRKGTVGRAIVGGVLLGPLGALGGAVTAGSKTKVNEKTTEKSEVIDTGSLILTNKRTLFIGKNQVVSMQNEKTLNILVDDGFSTRKVTIQYPEMMKGEAYKISGPDIKDLDLYIEGMKKL